MVVTSEDLRLCAGTITMLKRPGGNRAMHRWNAKYDGEGRWKITGNGWISSGSSRTPSSDEYPFSLDPLVNKGLCEVIADWLNANRNGKPVAPIPPPPKPPPPSLPPPEAIRKKQEVPAAGKLQVVTVRVSEIMADPEQPRQEFNDDDTRDMGGSLVQEKQKQLITITPIEGVPGKRWLLVDGERRYRGALAEHIEFLEAVVKFYETDVARFWDSFTMNFNQKGHTAMETSRALAKAVAGGKSVEQISVATSRSTAWVYRHLQLQKLAPALQALMRISVERRARLKLNNAEALSKVPSREEQVRIWEKASTEPSPALVTLKVKELCAPLAAASPQGTRKRKPSDGSARALRVLLTAEADMAFMKSLSLEERHALVTSRGYGDQTESVTRRMLALSESWKQAALRIHARR